MTSIEAGLSRGVARRWLCAALTLCVSLDPVPLSARAAGRERPAPAPDHAVPPWVASVATPPAEAGLRGLPLLFVENQGQVDPEVAYYVQGSENSVFLTRDGITFALASPSGGRWAVRLEFVDASPAVRVSGRRRSAAVVSYLRGSPGEWRADIPTFEEVVYEGLWPGIDLVYASDRGHPKYTFEVSPGADPSRIRLAYRGASRARVTETGRLAIETPAGRFEEDTPYVYQESGGGRTEVAAAFEVAPDRDPHSVELGFRLGAYDRGRPLVLDPVVLVYCGYMGGTAGGTGDEAFAIALDSAGSAYVAGSTTSANFPVTAGAYDTGHNGSRDVFVAKVATDGSSLVYATFIGGSQDDIARAIAVDGSGNAYVTGSTASSQAAGFPVLVGPDLSFNDVAPETDAFVLKLNAAGTALVYSGYIGGTGVDAGYGIAVDATGSAYVGGEARSDSFSFPVTAGAYDTTWNNAEGFLAKVPPSGAAPLTYCTYLGSGASDTLRAVAVDGSGSAYVTGYTDNSIAPTFPTTAGAYDTTHNGSNDAFVTRFNATGTALVYSTFLGGAGSDTGVAIALDSSGSASVVGQTSSANFPVTAGAYDTTLGGGSDGYVTKLDPAGSALVYSAYLGGTQYDAAVGIAVDASGDAYVVGSTASTEADGFPVTAGPDLTYNGGFSDAFVARINPVGSALVFCTYLGGSGDESGAAVATDGAGAAYVVGTTNSTNLPVLVGPDLTHNGLGSNDAFVAKIQSPAPCPSMTVARGTDRYTVTIPGSCEAVFDSTAGGGIKEFYDLEEDPSRTYDLAGGTNVGELVNQRISTSTAPAGEYLTGANNSAVDFAKAQLLEATPVRVRVRSESFLEQATTDTILPGLRAFRDWTLLPSGRMAYAFRLQKTNSTSYTLTNRKYELAVHYQTSGPLSTWTPGVRGTSLSWGGSTGFGGQDYIFAIAEPGTTGLAADFVMTQAYPTPTSVNNIIAAKDDADEAGWVAWNDTATGFSPLPTPSAPYSADPGQTWTGMVWLRPNNLKDDAEMFYRKSSDYGSPDDLTFARGSGWYDTTENTSSSADEFNDAEGVYALDMNPATGLAFDIDWNSFSSRPRRTPFFKIRGWRSLSAIPNVTLEGVALSGGSDYKAAVKPLARVHQANTLLWHSTLEDSTAVTPRPSGTLDVGSGGGVSGATFVAARYGNGALFTNNSHFVNAITGVNGFDASSGAVEFWYQPRYDHDGSASNHPLWRASWLSSNNKCMGLWHTAAGSLIFRSADNTNASCTSGTIRDVTLTSAQYSWKAYDWVHVRVDWSAATRMRLFLNGRLVGTSASYAALAGAPGTVVVGGCSTGCPGNATGHPEGILDEFHIWGGVGSSESGNPDPIGYGGLVGVLDSRGWSLDTLADTGINRTLGFTPHDGDTSRRGFYMLFGADSKFRGLSAALATPGAGSGVDLRWEYWNGTAWADLETVAGFGDTTLSFTRSGNLFWTTDPSGWSPYSVNGGPDLYYVRASMPASSGSYTTSPVEAEIRTDILLFQYCGDVSGTAQTFDFAAPVTTAVKLASFGAGGLDGAVWVEWATASELDNLGFHLYRGLSENGPWERVNESLIPGLGSSPEGKRYEWLDAGLRNGATYFYRLEDVDRAGRVTSHGPVSATPLAGEGSPGEGGGGGGGESPGEGEATPSGWTEHGDPRDVSLRVVSRDRTSVTFELHTGGFYSLAREDGSVRLFVPGFVDLAEPGHPTLPTRRTWTDAVPGLGARVQSVSAEEHLSFDGLVPPTAGVPQALNLPDGTFQKAFRPVAPAVLSRGLYPREQARVLQTAFQGDTKKAYLELLPLRLDAARGRLVLARRMLVTVLFDGAVPGETGLGGSSGRSLAFKRQPPPDGRLLARFATRQKGLHAVAWEDLLAATSAPGADFASSALMLDTASLRLSRKGVPVPFHVEPRPDRFVPGSTLFFLAPGPDDTYDGQAVFELAVAPGGLRMAVGPSSRGRSTLPPATAPLASLLVPRSFETNAVFLPALLDAEDFWLWDWGIALGRSVAYPFSLPSVVPAGSARLSVFLQGGSDLPLSPDHHVRVLLNATPVADALFDGMKPHSIALEVPASLLREGPNTLTLESVPDTGASSSFVYLDRFSLEYPHALASVAGVLEGTALDSGVVHAAGFAPGSVLLDLSGRLPRVLGRSRSNLVFPAEQGHRYLAVSPEAFLRPEIRPASISSLRDPASQADWILIAPRDLLPAAQPLLDLRSSQGLAATTVALEDVFDSFGFGEASPDAIRDFLAFAYHHWAPPGPRYVLLLGEASSDPRGFLPGRPRKDRLPTSLTRTSFLWAPSDIPFASVNGDDLLPDLAIGRLSANSLAEAEAAVQKILDFEGSNRTLDGDALLVADNPDLAGDFDANLNDVASLLAARPTQKLFLSQLGSNARPALLDALDSGPALVSYVGHGSQGSWASEILLSTNDIPSLAPQTRPPFVLTMTCSNGYFTHPASNGLAEELTLAPRKGAIAAFSPTGLSLDFAAHLFHKALVAQLESGSHHRIGDLVLAAQNDYTRTGALPELLSIYHLFGDPALVVR